MKHANLLLAFFCFTCISYAQAKIKTDQKATKNLVYLDYGSGFMGAHAALNYERTLLSFNGNNFSLKGGYGIYSYLIPTGDFYSFSAHYSYGIGFFNLETALGAAFLDREGKLAPFSTNGIRTFPLYYIGCKMKRATDKTVFKFGVGYPQLISLGIGIAF